MNELAIGNRVKIIFSTYDQHGNEGAFGTIIAKGVMRYDWIVRVEFPTSQTDDLGFNSDELELVEDEAPAIEKRPINLNTLSRDTVLRNNVFSKVQLVLDGCNPDVAKLFRNYGSIAEKQIQERDEIIQQLRAKLAEVKT